MNLNSNVATAATVAWALAIAVGGVALHGGLTIWAVTVVVALLPVFLLTSLRNREDPSISQSIQRVLR